MNRLFAVWSSSIKDDFIFGYFPVCIAIILGGISYKIWPNHILLTVVSSFLLIELALIIYFKKISNKIKDNKPGFKARPGNDAKCSPVTKRERHLARLHNTWQRPKSGAHQPSSINISASPTPARADRTSQDVRRSPGSPYGDNLVGFFMSVMYPAKY